MVLKLFIPFLFFITFVFGSTLLDGKYRERLTLNNGVVAFYNVYAGRTVCGDIIQTQVRTIERSGLLDKLDHVFYTTSGEHGEHVAIGNSSKFVHLVHFGEKGGELQTLHLLYKFCQSNPTSKVLYFHNKGSYHYNTENQNFVELLNCYVLNPHCIEALDDHDTCGWRISPKPYPHYSGNFWWARCDYVRKLIDPAAAVNNRTFIEAANHMNDCIGIIGRHFAETWIGTGPALHPADCMNSTIDSSYVWGYKVPAAAKAFCPMHGASIGLPCQTASTLTNVLDFKATLMRMSALVPPGRCRDNENDIVKRSQMMYGEDPHTFMKWMDALHAPLKLPENALVRFDDGTQVYVNKMDVLRGVPNLKTFMTFGRDFDETKILYAADRPYYKIGDMLPSA